MTFGAVISSLLTSDIQEFISVQPQTLDLKRFYHPIYPPTFSYSKVSMSLYKHTTGPLRCVARFSGRVRPHLLPLTRIYPSLARAFHVLTPRLVQHQPLRMSFSNTDTGSKTADPYVETNKDEASLEAKVEALTSFVSSQKFGMMTTRTHDGLLTSRAMALAAKVCNAITPHNTLEALLCHDPV